MNNSLELARHHFQETVAALKTQKTDLAIQRCRDFLVTSPGSLPHLQLLAHALVKQSQFTEAEQTLKHALNLAPDNPAFHDELGSLYAQSERLEDAVTALQQACHLQSNPRTYKKLASVLQLLGRDEEAEDAFNHFLKHDPINADVAKGAEHCRAGRHQEAEDTLKAVLRQKPDHVDAMRFLAMTYESANKLPHDAEALLRNAIKIAPDYTQALSNLGTLLLDRHKWQDAIEVYQKLVTYMPNHALAWASLAHAQTRNGDIDSGLRHYDRALTCDANSAGIHMSRAHLLKTLGRMPEALDAYRTATGLKPALGEAWWSMANLKIFRFDAEEVAVMMQQLERDDLSDEARVHFYFSLGKAFEDQKNYDQAWHHYHQGNQLQRTLVEYDPVEHEMLIDSLRSVCTAEVAAPLVNQGSDRADPIFIVGLPRSGSTLIEQILASHSQVEGTEELHNISALAFATGKYRSDKAVYPATLPLLTPRDYKAFAQDYLKQTKHHRINGKPFFIDKMPNNFVHIGFIKLMFPKAKIINTRRFPLDSLLGAYKQLFAKGQNFTYDMLELSEYYQSYVKIMDHWHSLFPGQILDVHYEHHMDDFEGQVRRILDYCGLPFEAQCLRFYETERAVKTASSEQVRQPIYKSALGLWKNYASHLSLWQEDLSEVIEHLPDQVKHLAG